MGGQSLVHHVAHRVVARTARPGEREKGKRRPSPRAFISQPRFPPPFLSFHSAALTLADFDLLRRLGSGAFAEVYLAIPKVPIPGVARDPAVSLPTSASAAVGRNGGWRSAIPPSAVALKVVDKHLLTRTPSAVDAVRRERDVMDALGGLAAAAAAAAEEAPSTPSSSSTSPSSASLSRLPPGLHRLWAATRTVRLLFTFQDASSLYFGLEACPGGDLFGQLSARGRLRLGDALPYLADAVAALASLAAVGVTHRDVKPENFMLDGGGRLKLGDFGCAAWAGGGADAAAPPQPLLPPPSSSSSPPAAAAAHPLARAARVPSFVGTADYVPPEALGGLNSSSSSSSSEGEEEGEGGGKARPTRPPRPPPPPPPPPFAADAWALGCLAYQLLVGVPPFRAATEYLTYQRIAAHDLRWPGGGRGGAAGSGGEEEEVAAGARAGSPLLAEGGDSAGEALPPPAVDLITRLLDPDPATRLGGGGPGGGGMGAVMAHPFFQAVDWSAPGGGLPAPPPVPPPPPLEGDYPGEDAISAAEDEVDWELASLAAALPIRYSYDPGQATPPGASGLVPPPPPRPASPGVAGQDWGGG